MTANLAREETSAPELQVFGNTPVEDLLRNVEINARRGLEWVDECTANNRIAVLVGGGPSLINSVDEINARQTSGQVIFALNGAGSYLKSRGVQPDWLVMVDARPQNIAFVRGLPARGYLLASQCDPSIFDYLKQKEQLVVLFHHASEGVESVLPKGHMVTRILANYTCGLVAMSLVHTLGYRNLHLFGYDSSDADGAVHAYAQTETAAEANRLSVTFDGREYTCSLAMFKQAEKFEPFARMLADHGATITVHGSGLLPAIAHKMMQQQ